MLDQYRCDFADFHSSCAREHYLFHSGQKNKLEIAPIYERYSHLFEQDTIEKLKSELDVSPTVSIKRLLAAATEQFLENSVKQLTEAISDYEATAIVQSNGSEMTFQDATVCVTTEGDREKRRAVYRGRLGVIEASNHMRAERLVSLHATTHTLGYSSYLTMFEHLRQLDYSSLAGQASSFISRTDPAYLMQVDEALRRELGLKLEEAERFDAMYFLHLTQFDERFPSTLMIDVYKETMAGLGIGTDLQTNIAIDAEQRQRKNPRAFCMPIVVPDDIRLVIRPSGGQSDYQSLLHESGHAQHYGWSS
ncbi:MAG TPA: hypothetical protein VN687_07395, partial [Blastocatellia bacterium]|nr:hypothetical protein [Blastocatellia bacterium]